MRRSLLFLPGNSPVMLQNGAVMPADALIMDLEDAVAPDQKDAARLLVTSALRTLDYSQEIIIRINASDSGHWQQDLTALVPCRPGAVMTTKSSVEAVKQTAELLTELERANQVTPGAIGIIALIETALGVEHAYEIATASERFSALFLGAEDLAADLRCERTKEGTEIFYSRSRLVLAARAAGIDAIDTPFTDVQDDEGIIADAELARSLGFSGKAAISPRHLSAINQVFSPRPEAIRYALAVMAALEQGKREGKGVVALDGKMIDAPIAARAEQVLTAAEKLGLLPER